MDYMVYFCNNGYDKIVFDVFENVLVFVLLFVLRYCFLVL